MGTSLEIRKNAPYYTMVAIWPNHGSSQKLVKLLQTRWVGRGAWVVHESSVEILISRSVFNRHRSRFAKMHLITLWQHYSQITEVHKRWSKCFKLAGWVEEHGLCMNLVSKSLYRDPFLTDIARDSQNCTLLYYGRNLAESRQFTKVGQNGS